MAAAEYIAHNAVVEGVEILELADMGHQLEVSIAPSAGNMVYEIKAGGKNILWSPFEGPADLKANPRFAAIPFLAPWANRIDGDSYWVDGKEYLLNGKLGNLRRDQHQRPIHGLIYASPDWKVVSVTADEQGAQAETRFDFWKYPDLMAQFPFAHNIVVIFRLYNGTLEIQTTLENLSAGNLPVAIGYHPYFQLDDAARDEWSVHLAAREHVLLNENLIPTGEREPVSFADPQPLKGMQFDDVFTNLVRGTDGKAAFRVEGKKQKITVTYGPKFPVAVVYAPPGRDFICFEPMAGLTNAFNLNHAGLYQELQTVPRAGKWTESFWITPSGF
jgi:aldose 1-epimerase